MLRRLKRFADTDQRDLPGVGFTRLADDIFEIDRNSLYGRHYCIASKPQGQSIRVLQETFPNGILPKLLVKSIIHRLWFSVNWFHQPAASYILVGSSAMAGPFVSTRSQYFEQIFHLRIF